MIPTRQKKSVRQKNHAFDLHTKKNQKQREKKGKCPKKSSIPQKETRKYASRFFKKLRYP